jgi:DegV family protein with EDD domain
VFEYLRRLGRLESHKAEDMEAQHVALGRSATGVARRPIAFVTDSACDLPEAMIRTHGIHVVPLSLVYEDRVLRDRIDIDADTFVERLRDGDHPSTSQPPPAAFQDAYTRAAEDGEVVMAVILAGVLSGTLASAQAAAAQLEEPDRVRVVDSRGISLLQGLLLLRAAELAELGWDAERIENEIQRLRGQSGVYFTVDTFDRLLASGRVSRGRAWLGSLLDIKPILTVDSMGAAQPASKVRGYNALVPKVLDLVADKVGEARSVRFGIIHVDAYDVAEGIRTAIIERFGPCEILTSSATPVIATHLGTRAWGLAYMVED